MLSMVHGSDNETVLVVRRYKLGTVTAHWPTVCEVSSALQGIADLGSGSFAGGSNGTLLLIDHDGKRSNFSRSLGDLLEQPVPEELSFLRFDCGPIAIVFEFFEPKGRRALGKLLSENALSFYALR